MMAAVLMEVFERDERGWRRRYRLCRAGFEKRVQALLQSRLDVGHDLASHAVEIDNAATDEDLLDAGWIRIDSGAGAGIWVCSEHAKTSTPVTPAGGLHAPQEEAPEEAEGRLPVLQAPQG